MELYLGGYAQGKLAYVLGKYGIPQQDVIDGGREDFEKCVPSCKIPVYNHYHLWVKRKLEAGEDPGPLTMGLLERNPGCIILCDEIGNGIVPLGKAEREYRERTGRLLCGLAGEADRVERVICGIGQRIK